MGYDLHITRQNAWHDPEERNTISLEEWSAYVQSDPEMRMDGFAEINLDHESSLRVDQEGLAVWKVYSKAGIDQNQAWFRYAKGNITVKNPDRAIIGKMIAIAKAMNAKVQGDEGELYGQENPYGQPVANPEVTKRPWWKIW